MIVNTYLGLILTVLFYIVLPVLVLLLVKNKKTIYILATIFISIFVFVLLGMTLLEVEIYRDVVTINMRFNAEWCSKNIHFSLLYGDMGDVIINIAMLIPIGAYIVIRDDYRGKKYTIAKSLLVGIMIGLFIETMQFILPLSRSVQLRDVLLNGLSAMCGAVVYMLVLKLKYKVLKIKE